MHNRSTAAPFNVPTLQATTSFPQVPLQDAQVTVERISTTSTHSSHGPTSVIIPQSDSGDDRSNHSSSPETPPTPTFIPAPYAHLVDRVRFACTVFTNTRGDALEDSFDALLLEIRSCCDAVLDWKPAHPLDLWMADQLKTACSPSHQEDVAATVDATVEAIHDCIDEIV